HHDRRQLAKLSSPTVRFTLGRADSSDGVPNRSVRIVVGGRRVGTVTVRVPFDQQLLTRLEHASSLPRHRQLAFTPGRSLILPAGQSAVPPAGVPLDRPTEVRTGGERYVAVSTVLTREAPATRLAVVAPASDILGSATAARWRLLL